MDVPRQRDDARSIRYTSSRHEWELIWRFNEKMNKLVTISGRNEAISQKRDISCRDATRRRHLANKSRLIGVKTTTSDDVRSLRLSEMRMNLNDSQAREAEYVKDAWDIALRFFASEIRIRRSIPDS